MSINETKEPRQSTRLWNQANQPD